MNLKQVCSLLICGVLLSACQSTPQEEEYDEPISVVSNERNQIRPAPVSELKSSVQRLVEEAQEFIDFSTVNMVNFAFDSDKLRPEDITKLNSQVRFLQANPNIDLVIEGHTDFLGTKEYNLALGERRANAVKTYLVSQGINAERIQVVSFGKSKPIDPALTDEARAQNRRAVSILK